MSSRGNRVKRGHARVSGTGFARTPVVAVRQEEPPPPPPPPPEKNATAHIFSGTLEGDRLSPIFTVFKSQTRPENS